MKKLRGRPDNLTLRLHREWLVKVASDEFLKKSFKGTSLDDIAAKAGVSKVTIDRRYGSKAGAVRSRCAPFGGPVAPRVPGDQAASPATCCLTSDSRSMKERRGRTRSRWCDWRSPKRPNSWRSPRSCGITVSKPSLRSRAIWRSLRQKGGPSSMTRCRPVSSFRAWSVGASVQ